MKEAYHIPIENGRRRKRKFFDVADSITCLEVVIIKVWYIMFEALN